MKYHVICACGEASIYEGPGPDSDATFDTFDEAKAYAIKDLDYWRDKIDGALDELRAAKNITDLSYHEPRNVP